MGKLCYSWLTLWLTYVTCDVKFLRNIHKIRIIIDRVCFFFYKANQGSLIRVDNGDQVLEYYSESDEINYIKYLVIIKCSFTIDFDK